MKSRATIQLTSGQADKILAALDYFLAASTDDEQLVIFGSGQGVAAAERAAQAIASAFYAK